MNFKKSIKETEVVIALTNQFIEKCEETLIRKQAHDIMEDAKYSSEVLQSKVCHTMTAIAKDLGMKSAQQLSEELCALGILMRSRSGWQLKSAFSDKKLAQTRTTMHKGRAWHYLVWTEKGRRWLHALTERNILQTVPIPKKLEGYNTKVEDPTNALIVNLPVKPTLIQLIEYIQQDFECLVNLAKDCLLYEGTKENRKALESDIRSINTDTSIVMRKLEEACYKSLAM